MLLVQERQDSLWTLPGGWADVNQSASESAIREVFEESGYIVEAVRLLALWDKQKHDHPYQLPHAYKAIFLCNKLGGEPKESLETSAIGWFSKTELPEFSTHRITKTQVLQLFDIYNNSVQTTAFD